MRILCKINPDQIYKESPLFFQGGQKRKIMVILILFKINPFQIVGKFPCIFFSRNFYKIYEGFVLISVKPTPTRGADMPKPVTVTDYNPDGFFL